MSRNEYIREDWKHYGDRLDILPRAEQDQWTKALHSQLKDPLKRDCDRNMVFMLGLFPWRCRGELRAARQQTMWRHTLRETWRARLEGGNEEQLEEEQE